MNLMKISNLIRIIQSEKIDIKNNNWIIYDPIITKDNLFLEKDYGNNYYRNKF